MYLNYTNLPENIRSLVLELNFVKNQNVNISYLLFDKTFRKSVYRSLLLGNPLLVSLSMPERKH